MAMIGSGPMKRVYKDARAEPSGAGFTVTLDGRALRTPGRAPLVLPVLALAEAVAGEWAAQEEEVRPLAMPLMGLACTAIDIVGPRRAAVVVEIADYGATDLLCYRVEHPPALVERQTALWQPLLDWAATQLDAPLNTAAGALAVAQPEDSLAALGRAVEAHDDLALAALAAAVKAAGSLVVGLALSHRRLDPEAAFEAAELHETVQIEAWGEDPEAARRRAAVLGELRTAATFLGLLRDQG
jgi:chaperone required for assembly of F1-ATPase